MTTSVSDITKTTATTGTAATSPVAGTSSAAETSDRFLKLLVAQMKNQDPLNPMDNAQVTSQMAQINTVSGIEKLNSTVSSITGQFVQMQAMQGAGLVGHDVTLQGDSLSISDKGVASGNFSLDGKADTVKVEVLNSTGTVVHTQQLGAQTTGKHAFDWDAGSTDTSKGLRIRVTATQDGAVVPATTFMRDRVTAVNTTGDALTLELAKSGKVAWADVQALN